MADVRPPRILLSNDDGINAHGLAVLEQIALSLSDDVWVVAPELEQSGASHSLTIHRPLRVRQLGPRRYAVDGTPTDCVLLAVNHLLKDNPPDLVLSGVNHGQNLGEDVTYSGTIAAAMEATLLGIPAIAMSLQIGDGAPPRWETAQQWGPRVVAQLRQAQWPRNVLINVNFPHWSPDMVTGIRVVPHGNRKIGDELVERTDPRGRSYIWIGPARSDVEVSDDSDIHAVAQGAVSVTPLCLDLTHYQTLACLRDALA